MKQARSSSIRILAHILAIIAMLGSPVVTRSEEFSLPAPEGPVVLKVTGKIQTVNAQNAAVFDLEGLESLGLVEVMTDTPWTDGASVFVGVLAKDILEAVGAQGENVRAVALNDYAVKIPIADFLDYNVIVATRRDGARMRVRDRGPLWVIYPWSNHPELRTEVYYSRSIWQVSAIEVIE